VTIGLCEHCGATLGGEERFCPRCGNGITRNGEVPMGVAGGRPARQMSPGVIQCGTCGNQALPAAQFCAYCGAPLDHVIPNEVELPPGHTAVDAPPPKEPWRAPVALKVALVLPALLIAVLGGGAWLFINSVPTVTPERETALGDRYRAQAPSGLVAAMPASEKTFCETLGTFAVNTVVAGGAKAPPEVLAHLIEARAPQLKELAKNRVVENWVGVVVEKPSLPNVGFTAPKAMVHSRGLLDLVIQLPCEARLITRSYADGEDGETTAYGVDWAMVPKDSPAYAAALKQKTGDVVQVTGELVVANDELVNRNTTDAARLLSPAFALKLLAVHEVARENGKIIVPSSTTPAVADTQWLVGIWERVIDADMDPKDYLQFNDQNMVEVLDAANKVTATGTFKLQGEDLLVTLAATAGATSPLHLSVPTAHTQLVLLPDKPGAHRATYTKMK
jgi:hypothetical protein